MLSLFYTSAFLIAIALLKAGLRVGQWRFIDTPNHRSLHNAPIARIGGVLLVPLFLVVSILLGALVQLPQGVHIAWCAVGGLWLLSVIDDAYGLNALLRFIVQLCLVLLMASFFYQQLPSWWWLLWSLYALSGLNFYNFMDGADGIATSQGIAGFAACGVFAWWLWPDSGLCEIAFLVVALLCGFLLFNWQPAKIFMGDAGSTVLGLAAALFAALFFLQDPVSTWLAVLPFSAFWLDAGATLLTRIFRGERFWQAHRQHLYQRQVLAGKSHRYVAMAYTLASLAFSAVGIVYLCAVA